MRKVVVGVGLVALIAVGASLLKPKTPVLSCASDLRGSSRVAVLVDPKVASDAAGDDIAGCAPDGAEVLVRGIGAPTPIAEMTLSGNGPNATKREEDLQAKRAELAGAISSGADSTNKSADLFVELRDVSGRCRRAGTPRMSSSSPALSRRAPSICRIRRCSPTPSGQSIASPNGASGTTAKTIASTW